MTSEELKDIVSEILFHGEIKFLEPMSRHTSLRIGGPADIFAVPEDVSSVVYLHDYLRRNDIN
jgi:UDP-N-acetylmuramate dehydrogenase